MALVSQVKVKTYYDSVRLMRASETVSNLEGVSQAIIAMGTDANKRVLAEAGLLAEGVESAGPNDLMIVVEASSDEAAQGALAQADVVLTQATRTATSGQAETQPKTLEQAHQSLSKANLAIVSTAGQYAALEAAKALHAGLHVFLFSDNVTMDEELALKQLAAARGRLVMGPGCGTSIINGVALSFANVVRRGPIGLVAASGTGLQEVTCLLDRSGIGISQAIGVGGRDMSKTINGLMTRQALAMLAADPETKVIVLISKPPSPEVTEGILDAAQATHKPVVVNFLGSKRSGQVGPITFTITLEETAEAALNRARGEEQPCFKIAAPTVEQWVAAERKRLGSGQRYLRGLFSGGSLCDEAMDLLSGQLPAIYSNIPLRPEWSLADAWQSREHSCIDMGDEEFTRGRPHPMIDPRLRQERILKEADDPSVAVILMDVVIGYGSHPNPAGALAETIRAAKARAAERGRYLAVVAHVCGTDQDPQDLKQQEMLLREARVLVLPTNAQAARIAAAIVS